MNDVLLFLLLANSFKFQVNNLVISDSVLSLPSCCLKATFQDHLVQMLVLSSPCGLLHSVVEGLWFLWSTELSGNLQLEQPLPYSPKRSACTPDYRRDRCYCQSLSNSHNIITWALVGYRDRLPRLIALLTMALLEVTV